MVEGKPKKRTVKAIRDLERDLEAFSDVTIYVAGSGKGSGRRARGFHGFGAIILIEGRRARSGGHASDSNRTTFHRGYLGAAMTALDWLEKNASSGNIAIKTNAEYVWLNAKDRLEGWARSGRLNATNPKRVENHTLWLRIHELAQAIVLRPEAWGPLESEHDRSLYAAALLIAQRHADALVAARSTGNYIPADTEQLEEFLFDLEDEENVDVLVARAVERDDRQEARRKEQQAKR